MKILKGKLKETRYEWPAEGCTDPPAVMQETVFEENGVTYMSDRLGLHRISNPDPDNFAISLHRKRSSEVPRSGALIGNEPGRSLHPTQCRIPRLPDL